MFIQPAKESNPVVGRFGDDCSPGEHASYCWNLSYLSILNGHAVVTYDKCDLANLGYYKTTEYIYT